MIRNDLRNIAIIAHVDHGKTTLVDQMLKQAGAFRENQVVEERVMDSGDIERERGITILAKNTSVHYKGVKINIVDTPGHADFSGEVERILKMVDGVVLLVDAAEGPMPQTRFVLQKALEFGHKIIIAINKIDRPDARLNEIGDEVLELLLNLDATDEQLDSPIVYCSGRAGTASMSPNVEGKDLTPLFEQILEHIPAPHVDTEGPTQMLVSSIDYNEYVGRIGIGRIERGSMKVGQQVTVCDYHGNTKPYNAKLVTLYSIEELGRQPIEEAQAGEIVCFSGIEGVTIGETLCDPEHVEALPFVKISEPTVEMTFMVNDSPFAGKEGKFVTSRHLRERLFRELLKDVSLRVNETDTTDAFRVCGRGEMHLSILIENLRREGYEFQVGAPKALLKEIDGKTCEPMERMIADVPTDAVGAIMEKMGARKGELVSMNPKGTDRMRLEFIIPARGLFGYRTEFLTDTKVELNGAKTNLAAYTINGSNYFKLRDLAAALKGLDSEFAVTWNAAQQRIDLTSKTAYTPVGGEQAALPAGNKAASLTSAAVYLDGKPLSLTAYSIGGNNYFKLRDLVFALGFSVDWNNTTSTVTISAQ